MKTFKQQIHDLVWTGGFGRFRSGDSFPVEFIQTSLPASDLMEDLRLARDMQPAERDFDLLMQRDIDDERVRRSIEPYINPAQKGLTEEQLKQRIVFFPPLLVAIVRVKDNKMEEFYPDEVASIDVANGYLVRSWGNLFKITFITQDGPSSYEQTVKIDGQYQKINTLREPVELAVRKAKGSEEGTALVVIDGQHRLSALRAVYETNKDLLKEMCVPVCILYAPCSTEECKAEYSPVRVPSVITVFRHLFVDVNTTMELVGGHFNILLSDSTISGLVCRRLCDHVLSKSGKEALAQIEWNTKDKKESTRIQKSYSITSIGVIDFALKKIFGGQRNELLKYVLVLREVEDDLYANDEEGEASPRVQWDKFSLNQKPILQAQVVKYLVPCLEKIFLESAPFREIVIAFKAELGTLNAEAKSGKPGSAAASAVLRQILDYMPIGTARKATDAEQAYGEFDEAMQRRLEESAGSFVRYAIAQRAILEAWSKFLEIGRKYNATPIAATEAFVELLDAAFSGNGRRFEPKRNYAQYVFWDKNKIKPTEDSKRGISNLIVAVLGDRKVAAVCAGRLDISTDQQANAIDDLVRVGKESAEQFMGQYKAQRTKDFIRTYQIDFGSLSQEQIQSLRILEEEHERQRAEVRKGERPKDKVSTAFHDEVGRYVDGDVTEAANDIRNQLGYQTDIVSAELLDYPETE